MPRREQDLEVRPEARACPQHYSILSVILYAVINYLNRDTRHRIHTLLRQSRLSTRNGNVVHEGQGKLLEADG